MFLNKLINKGYQAKQCQLCLIPFNLMKLQRIHKCKRCNKYICVKCGKHKQRVIDQHGIWTKDTHRICIPCNEDFMQIHDTIKNNNMQWNSDTPMSKQWLQNMKSSNKQHKIDFEYSHFLTLFNESLKYHSQQVQIIDKDVVKGRTDSSVFDFSMREFFYSVKADIQDTITRDNIKNVLYAIASRYNRIGYCQGMSGIAAFLLCFSSEQTAFIILCDLLQNVYANDFFSNSQYGISLSGLLAQTHFLSEYFIHYLKTVKRPVLQKFRGEFYDQSELRHFQTIIQLLSSKALLSLFVGIVSFSTCIFIWQQIKKYRTFEVVQKAFLAIIYFNRQKILQNRSFKILQQIFQRMNLEQFKQFYYDIDIDNDFKQKCLNEYYLKIKNNFKATLNNQIKGFTKLTNFTFQQIISLRDSFIGTENLEGDIYNKTTINTYKLIQLTSIYLELMKKQHSQQQIFKIDQQILRKIIEKNSINPKQNLDFRQFVYCLSISTKGNLRDKLNAMIETLKDQNQQIQLKQLRHFIQNFHSKTQSIKLRYQKDKFLRRMQALFDGKQKIQVKESVYLMNDSFVMDLSTEIKLQSKNIIHQMISQYLKLKVHSIENPKAE